MNTLQAIRDHQIVAIVRGADPGDVIHLAKALYAGGIRILEITMNSPQPLEAIKKTAIELGDKIVIGAGTVLDGKMAKQAIDAGARFILSPVTDAETIEATKRLGAISVPGAYTATEILHAHRLGGDIIKVFPANSPAYIKDILAPLPHLPLLPTGGVNLGNIKDFQKSGAVGFGVGSSLTDTSRAITDAYLQELTGKARRFVETITTPTQPS